MKLETRATMPEKFEAYAVYRALAVQALPCSREISQCLLHDIATREWPGLRERAIL